MSELIVTIIFTVGVALAANIAYQLGYKRGVVRGRDLQWCEDYVFKIKAQRDEKGRFSKRKIS